MFSMLNFHLLIVWCFKKKKLNKCQNFSCVLSPQDEFLDVIYWFRQIIAVILGIIWGVVPLKGFVGIAV